MQQYDKALADLNRAIELDPGDARAIAGDLEISPLSIAEIPQLVEGSASRCRG